MCSVCVSMCMTKTGYRQAHDPPIPPVSGGRSKPSYPVGQGAVVPWLIRKPTKVRLFQKDTHAIHISIKRTLKSQLFNSWFPHNCQDVIIFTKCKLLRNGWLSALPPYQCRAQLLLVQGAVHRMSALFFYICLTQGCLDVQLRFF